MDLTAAEGRVLGCLIEREAAAPDEYPLTLNALRLACNQTVDRDPVVAYDDRTVEDTLLALKSRGLARFVTPAKGDRTTRYRHRAGDRWRMAPTDLVVLAVLLLHGVQTAAEVRQRAQRLVAFDSPSDVDAVLDMLAARTPRPFAARLELPGNSTARGPGRGATLWAEVLTGPPPDAETVVRSRAAAGARDLPVAVAVAPPEGAPSYADLVQRITELERRLATALVDERPAGSFEGPANGADEPADSRAYQSSDWRAVPTLPLPPPPPVPAGVGLPRARQSVSEGDRDRPRALPAAAPPPPPGPPPAELADRVRDIERRLVRIEAELAALQQPEG